jgi:hypothetical protein
VTASFRLTLDTVTHVAAAINGGKGTTEKPTVTLELALDPDAALVKIWGDINPLDPMNAGMGTTEESAEWLSATADWLIALTTNPGGKELHVATRDDVDNEARASASINLVTEETVPPVEPEPTHPGPLPATGGPEVVPEPTERRRVVSTSSIGAIGSSTLVAAVRVLAPVGIGQAPRSSSSTSSSRHHRSEVTTRVEDSVRVRVVGLRQRGLEIGSAAAVDRRDGGDFIASLVELGIL